MQIYNPELNIDILEFSDRFEVIRSTSGCTIRGKIEFDARIKLLGQIINRVGESDPLKPFGQIYLEDREFAHHCDRCLELNGIDPEWLTESHIYALLFKHGTGLGMLVTLNAINNQGVEPKAKNNDAHVVPEQSSGSIKDARLKANVYHQMLAGLYKLTDSPTEALDLATNYPYKDVMGMLGEVKNKNMPNAARTKNNSALRKMSDRNFMTLMKYRQKVKNRD